MDKMNVDCLLCPPGALPPYRDLESGALITSIIYTAMFNTIDFPAGIIPNVRKVQVEDLTEPYVDEKYGNDELA